MFKKSYTQRSKKSARWKILKQQSGEFTELEKNQLDINNEGIFSLEEARCLGTCALAPVIKIEEDVYSKVTEDQVEKILEKYYKKEKK